MRAEQSRAVFIHIGDTGTHMPYTEEESEIHTADYIRGPVGKAPAPEAANG